MGLYLIRHRATVQKAYQFTLGTAEFHNENDMPTEWVESLAEDEFDEQRLGMDINSRRAFRREGFA